MGHLSQFDHQPDWLFYLLQPTAVFHICIIMYTCYIYDIYICICKYVNEYKCNVNIYIVCCMLYIVFTYSYIKQAYLLLTLPMKCSFHLSWWLKTPPFSDLAATAGTGPNGFGPDPGGKRGWIFAVDVWLVSQPETKRNTDDTDDVTYFLHIFMRFIYFCILYLLSGISSLILVPSFLGGPTQSWQDGALAVSFRNYYLEKMVWMYRFWWPPYE